MKTWPTKSHRPPRRATFGRAASIDNHILYLRRSMRARQLGEIDWILHQKNCNPYRGKKGAENAYNNGLETEQRNNPHPTHPPLPDLPRARKHGRK